MRCSVVIPTYNRSASLMRTLDSLAAQSIPVSDFEVIVVSDGSTDDTVAKLAEYQQTQKLTLVIIDQPNAGPGAARNRGVSAAMSQIIVFTDDDVEPVPQFIERHLSHHESADNIIVLGPLSPSPKWQQSEPVWIAWEHEQLQNIYNLFKPSGDFAGCNGGFEHFYSGNASMKKHWLVDVGGFDTDLRRQEDTELAARIKKYGDVVFVWDFEADGLHHPVRTLGSWLRIPVSYGEVDAKRVISGALDAGFIESNDHKRHKITKLLDDCCSKAPGLLNPLTWICCILARMFYAMGQRKIAFLALSALYNVSYMQAYRRTIRSLTPLSNVETAKAA